MRSRSQPVPVLGDGPRCPLVQCDTLPHTHTPLRAEYRAPGKARRDRTSRLLAHTNSFLYHAWSTEMPEPTGSLPNRGSPQNDTLSHRWHGRLFKFEFIKMK